MPPEPLPPVPDPLLPEPLPELPLVLPEPLLPEPLLPEEPDEFLLPMLPIAISDAPCGASDEVSGTVAPCAHAPAVISIAESKANFLDMSISL
jgi:hypothetical protein